MSAWQDASHDIQAVSTGSRTVITVVCRAVRPKFPMRFPHLFRIRYTKYSGITMFNMALCDAEQMMVRTGRKLPSVDSYTGLTGTRDHIVAASQHILDGAKAISVMAGITSAFDLLEHRTKIDRAFAGNLVDLI